MTKNQAKVIAKYPEAEVVHRKILGLTIYAIRKEWYSGWGVGFGVTAARAWKDAAERIDKGVEPERLNAR